MPLFLGLSHLAGAATYTVTITNDSGAGSLRQAMINANNGALSNYIAFNLTGTGPFTITPASALPAINSIMTIDATTQPGYAGTPRVFLNGTNAGSGGIHGFDVQFTNCTIQGLAIGRFSGDGIRLESSLGGGNVIRANFIGLGVYGTNSAPNGWGGSDWSGIGIYSPSNLVGGIYASNRNVISGNTNYGIVIDNSSPTLADGNNYNIIEGNYIGTDLNGSKSISNRLHGIIVYYGQTNIIGGAVGGAGNLISGNGQSGIYLFNGCNGNIIQGNLVGVNAAGNLALSNGWDGITIYGVPGPKYNLIGGTNSSARNVVSGNGQRGIYIANPIGATGSGLTSQNVVEGNFVGVSFNGLAKIPNSYTGVELNEACYNIIGGTNSAAGNVISGNGLCGVTVGSFNATGNVVQYNLIGLAANGTNALGNMQHGIVITTGTNLIGPGNVISGNTYNGIYVTNKSGVIIQGNYIGTDFTGEHSVSNALNGLWINSPANLVGGLTPAARNIISGNGAYGIYLPVLNSSSNLIEGNYIGTDANGTSPLGNSYTGIGITNASNVTIGGGASGARNVISGNNLGGITVMGNNTANNSTNNVIQGNYIGTDFSGTAAVPNSPGDTFDDFGGGIDISASPFNLIGGSTAGAGNVISGNYRNAICIGEPGSTNNIIQGNLVGVAADGVTPLGNVWSGVDFPVTGGSSGTLIGGTNAGASNVIANATLGQRSGIRIKPPTTGAPPSTNLFFCGNAIYGNGGNGGFGILYGTYTGSITPNNSGWQNYPVLAAAATAGGNTTISGTLNSLANTSYYVQFFANAITNGNIQGQFFLGGTNVTTGANSNAAFSVTLPVMVPAGQVITATASDPAGNTSEFSLGVGVTVTIVPPALNFVPGTAGDGSPLLTFTWPTNSGGFTLVETTNLTPPAVWTPVPDLMGVTDTNNSVTVTATNANVFYRLKL